MRKSVLLLGVIMLCCINEISSQTPQQDLSKGNYLLMQKPFQIEAWSYPNFLVNGVLEDRFNPGYYAASNFSSFGVTHSSSELEDYPLEVQHMPWSRIEEVHHGLSAFELTKINTLFRLQFEDDNLTPTDTTLVKYANLWFTYKRSNHTFDNTILSVDLPFHGYGSVYANQQTNMLSLLKPDIILFNRYPWEKSDLYNQVQLLYGWYGMLIYYRNIAIKGIDGTGSTPIPFGAYTQTWFANQTTPPSYSQIRLNHFGSLAFGAKVLSAFVYNDYPGDITNTIKSFLFKNELPTPQFYQQAEINKQITNLGPALLRLQTSDIRFVPRKSTSTFPGGTDIATLKWVEIDKPRPDTYLTDIKATRTGFPDIENGDVLVGYFKPIHKSLDGTNTTNENYFMIVNALYGNDSVSTFQNVRLNFNFGELSSINSLQRINRLTGNTEVVPLVKVNMAGNIYYYDLLLNGGECDLFKYNDGVPFVGFPGLTSLKEANMPDKEVLLYPNPANDILHIKLSENNNRLMLYDVIGNKVYDLHVPADYQLDMSDFKTGIYFLRVENAIGILNGKVMKK